MTRIVFAGRHYGLPNFFGNLWRMADAPIRRLGELVKQRRQQLGIAQEDLRDYGGPSSTTLSRIELGTADKIARITLRKLDESLQWAAGSAARTLAGGQPTLLQRTRPVDNEELAAFARDVVEAAGAIATSVRAAERELTEGHQQWAAGHLHAARAVTAQLIANAMRREMGNAEEPASGASVQARREGEKTLDDEEVRADWGLLNDPGSSLPKDGDEGQDLG